MPIILLYHRVTETETDPQQLCVSPHRFDEHLAAIQRYFQPISMAALTQGWRRGTLPADGVAVTFDDGYADNYHQALPILSRHHIPADFYVTAGQVGRDAEFWWDAMEYLMLYPHDLPQRFHATMAEGAIAFDLGGSAKYGQADFQRLRHWNIFEPVANPRQEAYLQLCEFIRPLPADRERRRRVHF